MKIAQLQLKNDQGRRQSQSYCSQFSWNLISLANFERVIIVFFSFLLTFI